MKKITFLTIACLFTCSMYVSAIDILDVAPGVSKHNDAISQDKHIPVYDRLNIPLLIFPGITQEDFEDAFKVLDETCVDASKENPVLGFIYPFCGPGGGYGACWWQLDTSLALNGIKWVNQKFAENVLRNFMIVQKENGRIALWGNQPEEVNYHSSLPKLFQVSYEILKGTKDEQLIKDTYIMLKKYLDWWLTEKWDEKSGLIKGISEEWLPGGWAFCLPVETNVEVSVGCNIVAKLAEYHHDAVTAQFYREKAEAIKKEINAYLWNEKEKCFMNMVENYVFDGSVYSVTAFDPFKLNIADAKYHGYMLEALTDDNLFQWSSIPLTSAAKTDAQYNETPGVYVGHQWYGSIWSLRNYVVLEGLEDIGRFDLASHLAFRTVEIFNNNYTEFLNPPNGSGEGVLRYSWTASQYIQILIEQIFGISFDRFTNNISIEPHIDASLKGKTIELKQLLLPNNGKLDVKITSGEKEVRVSYRITETSKMNVTISLPTYNQRTSVVGRTCRNMDVGYGQVCTVENGEKYSDEVIFTYD